MSAEGVYPVEIACDESGSEGEKLVGGNTAVFAHASVRISREKAAACVAELRRRIRSPAVEYKANHLLRHKHRGALMWLLGPSGPIYGQARVSVVEKAYFLVRSLVLRAQPRHAVGGSVQDALTLHRDAPALVGPDDWHAFLEASNQLLWARNGDLPRPTAADYAQLLDRLRQATAGHAPGDVLEIIWSARADIAADQRPQATTPALDPIHPALVRAIEHWSASGEPVSITHDQQSTITAGLIAELKQAWPTLTDVRLVDSMDDARVQVADFLAGVARRIAEDALTGKGDAELTTLLRPYVDPRSIWGDRDSWTVLEPRNNGQ